MFIIIGPSSEVVYPGVVHLRQKDAEAYASRRLNDPPRKAPQLSSFPRKTWRDLGYQVVPADNLRHAGSGHEPAHGIIVRADGPWPFGFPDIRRYIH